MQRSVYIMYRTCRRLADSMVSVLRTRATIPNAYTLYPQVLLQGGNVPGQRVQDSPAYPYITCTMYHVCTYVSVLRTSSWDAVSRYRTSSGYAHVGVHDLTGWGRDAVGNGSKPYIPTLLLHFTYTYLLCTQDPSYACRIKNVVCRGERVPFRTSLLTMLRQQVVYMCVPDTM